MTITSHEEREIVRRLKERPRTALAIGCLLMLLVAGLCYGLTAKKPEAVDQRKAIKVLVTAKIANSSAAEQKFRTCPIPNQPISIPLLYAHRWHLSKKVANVAMQVVSVNASVSYISKATNQKPETKECRYSFGTGFIAKSGVIVTVAHTVWDLQRLSDAPVSLTVVCYGASHPAKLLTRDDHRDIMILSAPECEGENVTIGSPKKRVRQAYVTGYTYNTRDLPGSTTAEPKLEVTGATRFLTTTKPRDDRGWCKNAAHKENTRSGLSGLLRPHQTTIKDGSYIAYDKALIHGNSGSPLMIPSGKIIGMFVIINVEENFSCYISGSDILEVLNATNL